MSQIPPNDSEIKPCPFCNLDFNQAPMYTLPTIEKDFIHNCMGGLILKHFDWRIGKLLWQNAYCWKELSQQREKYEAEIELMSWQCSLEAKDHGDYVIKTAMEINSLRQENHEMRELLKNYWTLLQKFYDSDKQQLPVWHKGMFEEQEKIEKILAKYPERTEAEK